MKTLFTTLLLTFVLFNSLEDAVASPLLETEKRIIKVYKEAVPSVVNVANIKYANNFFYGKVEIPQGTGSGFVWGEKGHIVTNFHVIQGGNSFIVTFHKDKKQYKAQLVGVAPKQDIAVLKLKEVPKNLVPIKVGTSKGLQVGQIALALGNPYGFDHSLSKGIVSAVERKIDGVGGVKIHNMIQTDTAINQGNSGGPLLASSGELIGMNTLIVSGSGSSAGLGFAVPVDTISDIIPQLIRYGKVIRPGLGIGLLEDEVRERFVGKKGAALSFVDPDGAAGEAGLKGMMRDSYGRVYVGDVIIKINEHSVNSRDDIYHVLGKYKIGETITITYIRNKKKSSVEVKLKAL